MKLAILRSAWGRFLVLGVLLLLTGLWCVAGLHWAIFLHGGGRALIFDTVTWRRGDLPGVVRAGPWQKRQDGPGNEREIVFRAAIFFEATALEYDQQMSDDPMYARYRLQTVHQRKSRVYAMHAMLVACGLALAGVWWVFLRRCRRELRTAGGMWPPKGHEL